MTKLLTSSWMTIVISALIYFGATVAFWKTPVRARAPQVLESPGSFNGPSWEFTNPEADQLMSELKDEKAALAKKEQDLNDLASRLNAEKSELDLVTQSVKKLQGDFDQSVLRIKDEETANLKKLAKVYADMSPDGAANIMDDLDDTSIAKIMVYMKDSETAAILEAIAKKSPADAKRAAGLSERLRLAEFRNNTAAK